MKPLGLVCFAALLCAAPSLAQEAPLGPVYSGLRMPLHVALYVSPEAATTRPDFWGGKYETGQILVTTTQSVLNASFANVTLLDSFPPNGTPSWDLVLVVDTPRVEPHRGFATNKILYGCSYKLYSKDGSVQLFEQAESEEVPSPGWRPQKQIPLLFQKMATENLGRFLHEVALLPQVTALIAAKNVPPPPPASPPVLTLSVQPSNVQVYVDDVFKGMTSADGHLVVEGLAPGSHRVRMNLIGYTEAARTVELKAGETATLEAKLESAGPKPLALAEIEEALTNGLPPKGITKLVKQYGVDFTLTKEVEQRLREKGADSDLLVAIATGKR